MLAGAAKTSTDVIRRNEVLNERQLLVPRSHLRAYLERDKGRKAKIEVILDGVFQTAMLATRVEDDGEVHVQMKAVKAERPNVMQQAAAVALCSAKKEQSV